MGAPCTLTMLTDCPCVYRRVNLDGPGGVIIRAHCLIHARIKMRFPMARRETKKRLHSAFFKRANFHPILIPSRMSSAQSAENDMGNIRRNCRNKCVSSVYMQCVDQSKHTARTRARAHTYFAQLTYDTTDERPHNIGCQDSATIILHTAVQLHSKQIA